MRFLGHFEQFQGVVWFNPCLNHFLGDKVGTLDIHRHAIHLEIEGATDAVRLIHHLKGSNA